MRSAKLEYLYVDLGTVSNAFVTPLTGSVFAASERVTEHVVRVGLNYKFGYYPIGR